MFSSTPRGSGDSPSNSSAAPLRNPILFLDNGGYSVKAVFFPHPHDPSEEPRVFVVPNCVGAATYAGKGIVGDQIKKLPHFHGFLLRRPVDRGFIVEGRLQAYIWGYILQHFGIEEEGQVDLWLTSPFAATHAVAKLLHVLLVERFGFRSVTFVSSSFLALLSHAYTASTTESAETVANGTALVVDAGFSSTTVVPYVDFLPVYSSIVRVDVGGKVLTNRLKEHLSFTQINVLEDGWLVNHIREKCCRVSPDPQAELKVFQRHARATTRRFGEAGGSSDAASVTARQVTYFLPTMPALLPLGCTAQELFSRLRPGGAAAEEADDVAAAGGSSRDGGAGPGSVKGKRRASSTGGSEGEAAVLAAHSGSLQKLTFCQEAFLIPELVFTPGDVGVPQMGITQAVTQGVFQRGLLRHTPLLRQHMLQHVCVYGGTSNTPGFRERLYGEVEAAFSSAQSILDGEQTHPATKRVRRDPNADVVDTRCSHSSSLSTVPSSPHHSSLCPSFAAAVGVSTAATSARVPISSVEGALQLAEMQVIYGACLLLGASGKRTAPQQQALMQHRKIAQERSYVVFGKAHSSPDMLHEALMRLL